MMGLRFIDVSIYQLLRGSGVIFVALMKQNFLGHKLYNFQWIGVCWNVVSVILVGLTAVLGEEKKMEEEEVIVRSSGSAIWGVVFIMAGAFVQACQYVYEEKMMNLDIPAPPLLLIGMEGLWGTILCVTVVYPLVYFLPGADHGSYENPFNTWYMITHSSAIQLMFVVYFFAIFGYNLFAVLVTYLMNSIWHAILDNFRPITVWMADLFIHYAIISSFGEKWDNWSYLQLLGMFVLLYGTAIYNGPNDGSISLKGEWFALGLDFSKEYLEIQLEEEELEAELAAEAEWELRQLAFRKRSNSSFIGDRQPFVAGPTIHTHHSHHSHLSPQAHPGLRQRHVQSPARASSLPSPKTRGRGYEI
jgi:drug/metabolite transporter (DMT)-like permease